MTSKMKILTSLAALYFLVDNILAMNVNRQSVETEVEFRRKVRDETPKAATFAFAKHFQDHMVLQQAPTCANIYGFAPESSIGQLVKLQLTTPNGNNSFMAPVVQGRAPGLGEWLVSLNPVKGGTTVSISVTLQGQSLTLNDVIFGDVWICSGESNMQFTVSQMFGGQEEIADAHNYPNIRLMTVAMRTAATPQYDLMDIEQHWTRPDNASVGGKAWSYFSAVCWLYGKNIHKALGYPIGLISTTWGGTPAEAWSSKDALEVCNFTGSTSYVELSSETNNHDVHLSPQNNSVLWNAMIYPLLNMTIYGAIWYQGESDAFGERSDWYFCTFCALIADWRDKFHRASQGQTPAEFPFGFVQLAPNASDATNTSEIPDIRFQQTSDWGYVPNKDMPNVFMAVAMDLPDFNSTYGSIHPRDKKDVADRLTLSGLGVAYNQNHVMYQGPFPVGPALLLDDDIEVPYGDQWTLEIRNTDGFEAQCSNIGSPIYWIPTPIIRHYETSVTINRPVCPMNMTVTYLRYEWKESPCAFKKCAVYESINGLPASPFTEWPVSQLDPTNLNTKRISA